MQLFPGTWPHVQVPHMPTPVDKVQHHGQRYTTRLVHSPCVSEHPRRTLNSPWRLAKLSVRWGFPLRRTRSDLRWTCSGSVLSEEERRSVAVVICSVSRARTFSVLVGMMMEVRSTSLSAELLIDTTHSPDNCSLTR